MTKNLRVSDAAYARLSTIKRSGETLTAAFDRIIDEHNPLAGLGEVLASPGVAEQLDAEYEAGRRYDG